MNRALVRSLPPSSYWRPFAHDGLIVSVLVATGTAAVLFAAYGLLVGAPAVYWQVLIVAAAGFAGWLLHLRGRRTGPALWTLYAVPVLGSVVLSVFVVTSGVDPLRFIPAFALIAVVIGAGFPRAGQLVLQVFTAGCLAGVLLADGRAPADLLVPVGLYAVVAYVAGTFSRDLQDAIRREADAAADAELRTDLLRAAVAIHDLDVQQAGEAAVAAMIELGFEIATLAVVDDSGLEMVPVATVGMADEIRAEPIPVGKGLAGRAVATGETVEVEDYEAFAGRLPGRGAVRSGIAVPIEVSGRPGAVLQGGRRTPGRRTPAEREVVEVLAAQIGRAIENARTFEVERRAVERLRQLDELKGEFVSNVSHELRTPLTVIQGLGQTLAARQEALDGARRRDLLQRIAANAERLGTMIDAMLDFSRFETDGVRPTLEVVDLGQLALLAAQRLEPLLSDRPLEVLIESAGVECDPSLIEHVIENLIGNAAKHTPAGTRVRIVVAVEDGTARVEVEDRGEGVAEDELPYLTERFFRGAVQSRHPSPGLGLGLALVRQILDGHGSRLEVENVPGGGARFGFRLPLAPVGAGAAVN